jgi:cytochrome c oxidase assembly factor CtaG
VSNTLETYRKSWQAKPLLQDIYDDFYERIIQACVPGRTVEIGGGIGMLKRRLPDLITTDIQFASWLDCVADAQALPFAENTISNIAMVDVLHHVEFPMVFFEEAARY